MSSTLLGSYNFKQTNLNITEDVNLEGLSNFERFHSILKTLVKKIQNAKEPAFLLPALLDAFNTINRKKWLKEPLNIGTFEFWLNHFSGLSLEEEICVRGKIGGKKIPRESYQRFFPIGMNKFYPGTHFVCAHISPDLDTTVASFISWIDAFTAKVGLAMHTWSLPQGPSDPSYFALFKKLWGIDPFPLIASYAPALTLKARDLMTRKGVKEVTGSISINEVDKGLHETPILLVDQEGYFIGDWHPKDAEKIRPIIILFKSLLRDFESGFSIRILRFFADKENTSSAYSETFHTKIHSSNALKGLNEEEKDHLNVLLKDVLGVQSGLDGTFEELSEALQKKGKTGFSQFKSLMQLLDKNKNQQAVFEMIENLIAHLNQAINECRQWVEELGTAVQLKLELNQPLGIPLSLNSPLEEIRTKIASQDYLTVLAKDEGRSYPLGVISKQVLARMPLGTVSLRDFSNFEEVHMPSYLNVISVIDHHKTSLQTSVPSLILVGDAQSCNTLIAEQLFLLNNIPLQKGEYIHPDRKIAEYFSCLYAILDDTDYLSKVSARDLDCVAELLNQLKFLIAKERSIDLSVFPRDTTFIAKAAKRILQNPDMHSIYEKIIQEKEKTIQESLQSLSEFLLADTKEQNGYARIGQTKLFPQNFPLFQEKKGDFLKLWLEKAEQVYQAHPDIALHLQMISTIPSSEELLSKEPKSAHADELWVWIPDSTHGEGVLATFLNAFLDSPNIKEKVVKIEIFDDKNGQLEQIFEHNFLPLPPSKRAAKERFAIIYVKTGSLNSRKSMVSPYLPRRF